MLLASSLFSLFVFFFVTHAGTLLSDTYNISDHFCVNKKKEEKPRRFVFSLFSKPRNPHNALISEFKVSKKRRRLP
jgi:hypothetical protein